MFPQVTNQDMSVILIQLIHHPVRTALVRLIAYFNLGKSRLYQCTGNNGMIVHCQRS